MLHKKILLKQTQIILMIGLILLIGINQTPINAISFQSDNQRQQKIQIGHTIYIINKSQSTLNHLSNYQIKVNLHQLKAQTLHDIRAERVNHLSTQIEPDHKLNKLATLRARQISKHFSHYGHDYRPMTNIDAHRVKLSHSFQASENIASASLGNCTIVGDPKIYHNHTGRDMANMSNDGMMNYDELENNGHRKNILSSDNTLIGIGDVYNKRKQTFYLAEDFGNRNPQSSADVEKSNLKAQLKPFQQKFSVQKIFLNLVHKISHLFQLGIKIIQNWF